MLILFVYLAIIIRHCCYTTEQNSWVRPNNEINTLTFMYINCTVHALTLRCVFKKKLAPNVRRQLFFYFILVLQSSHVIYYVWIECGPGESLYWLWRQGSRSHSLFSGQKFLCCVIHPVLTTVCCAQLLLIWVNLIRTTNIAQIERFFFLLFVPIPILQVCVIH